MATYSISFLLNIRSTIPPSFNAEICQIIYDKNESRELIRYSPYHPFRSSLKPGYFPVVRRASFYEKPDAFGVAAVDVDFGSMENRATMTKLIAFQFIKDIVDDVVMEVYREEKTGLMTPQALVPASRPPQPSNQPLQVTSGNQPPRRPFNIHGELLKSPHSNPPIQNVNPSKQNAEAPKPNPVPAGPKKRGRPPKKPQAEVPQETPTIVNNNDEAKPTPQATVVTCQVCKLEMLEDVFSEHICTIASPRRYPSAWERNGGPESSRDAEESEGGWQVYDAEKWGMPTWRPMQQAQTFIRDGDDEHDEDEEDLERFRQKRARLDEPKGKGMGNERRQPEGEDEDGEYELEESDWANGLPTQQAQAQPVSRDDDDDDDENNKPDKNEAEGESSRQQPTEGAEQVKLNDDGGDEDDDTGHPEFGGRNWMHQDPALYDRPYDDRLIGGFANHSGRDPAHDEHAEEQLQPSGELWQDWIESGASLSQMNSVPIKDR